MGSAMATGCRMGSSCCKRHPSNFNSSARSNGRSLTGEGDSKQKKWHAGTMASGLPASSVIPMHMRAARLFMKRAKRANHQSGAIRLDFVASLSIGRLHPMMREGTGQVHRAARRSPPSHRPAVLLWSVLFVIVPAAQGNIVVEAAPSIDDNQAHGRQLQTIPTPSGQLVYSLPGWCRQWNEGIMVDGVRVRGWQSSFFREDQTACFARC